MSTLTPYRVLCVTDQSDLPETELFIGLHNAGVDIEVIGNPNGRHFRPLKQAGVATSELILKGRIDKAGIRFIKHKLQHQHYDILYCFNNRAASNALIASRGINIIAMTYRGVTGNIGFLYPTSWMTHLHPKVKRIVCVSNSVKAYFLSLHFLWHKLKPSIPVTIYKGHELAWYQQTPADLSQFGIPSNAFVAAFAGRNRPNKGLQYIVDSSHHIPANTPIHYLLIGKLDTDKKLRQQIEQSPLRNNFHFTGFRDDAPALIAACDTFIMPSVFKEGFSRAVIEAMAYAVPPIVTNIGGNPELVEQQQSGLLIAPKSSTEIANAIMALYNDEQLKNRLGHNAKQRIKTHFSSNSTVAATKKLFEQLVEQHPNTDTGL